MKKRKYRFRATEKPDPQRPQLWFQPARNGKSTINASRLRMFYPNGKAEWHSFYTFSSYTFDFDEPCWRLGEKPKTMLDAFALAAAFDKEEKFSPMQFVANL